MEFQHNYTSVILVDVGSASDFFAEEDYDEPQEFVNDISFSIKSTNMTKIPHIVIFDSDLKIHCNFFKNN